MELLRAAAAVAEPTGRQALPDDELGFALLYDTPPDLEAERARLTDILGAGGFDLFPYGEEDPRQLFLNFPGIPLEQSPDYIIAQGEELRQALGLVAVLPEVPPLYTDAEFLAPALATESFGAIMQAVCLSSATEPNDPLWPIKMIKADKAWAKHGVTGRGIRVAQPDTGVADHRELNQGVRKDLGHNYLDGVRSPTDPLTSTMGAPGHGTKTGGTVVSRSAHVISGSAPGCELVPLRAVNAVVLRGGRAVGLCVDHARVNDFPVVTMSLGAGWPLWSLGQAISRAVAADLIVLAAAGNCVGRVTYPASDAEVIAVAGVDVHAQRWRGSCRGRAVDISAPAENVHTALRTPNDGGTSAAQAAIDRRSQGTSFAVALTAGVAALWLEKHGRANVIAEARRRGTVVQEVFRAALKHTAHVEAGWDSTNMGAGIVDAEKLLDTPLSAIPPVARKTAQPLIAELAPAQIPLHLQTEAGLVAMDWHLRSTPGAIPLLETGLAPEPSAALAALLDDKGPAPLASPALVGEPATPLEPVSDALRRLATGEVTGRESAETLTPETALQRLRDVGATGILDQAESALASRAGSAPDLVDTGTQAEALDRIAPALENLITAGDLPDLTPGSGSRAALEALVRLTGRPAVRFRGDFSELDDPLLSSWADDLRPIRGRWYPYAQAVGRIDVEVSAGNWVHAGTGFRISDTHVITNRHVIDQFAQPLPSPDGSQRFHLPRPVSINFDPGAADDAQRFALGPIVTAGARRIGRFVDLSKLDLAILEMTPDNGAGTPPPPAPDPRNVSLTDDDITRLLVTGYPAAPVRPDTQDADGPDPFWDRIDEIYGEEYGVKYISPGYVMNRPGAVTDDPRGWSYSHDATTLGGNSGSAIMALHGSVQLAGIHFGGARETRNLAHDLVRVIADGADGVFDVSLLKDPDQ